MTQNSKLCVHGHFYQPPRENPWIEAVEHQESAVPFHDWNERIHHECYLPNARARVLDADGKVTDIVNNYEKISFNFGPTLMAWLEQRAPMTLQMIVRADKESAARCDGHGNAMAQAYNHMILPLANARDKITQIRWGVADFRFRFGREPEALWLPETACNEATLEALVEEKIKFIVLEPHQAQAVRALGGQDIWRDVSGGEIDPRLPYRCFLKKDPAQFIDIFFYDGPISKALGFEDVLFDAKAFLDRLSAAANPQGEGSGLIHVATDGETYGHHKPFGDRVLAYALNVEAPARGFEITNYAKFPLKKDEITLCLKLLEIQRHAMLMYTSCGWFFTEISGIETVQILQYAARAIQLAHKVTSDTARLEEEFLERLSAAKSNIPEFKDGREIYRRFVTPSLVTLARVVAQYAILSVCEELSEAFGVNCFKIEDLSSRKESTGHMTLAMGRVRAVSTITREDRELVYIVLRFGHYDFRCSVRSPDDLPDIKDIEEALFTLLKTESVVELLRKIDEHFGTDYFSLKDLLVDQRKKMIAQLTRQSLAVIGSSYERIYEENRGVNEIYSSLHLAIPDEIRYAAEYTLSRQLLNAVQKMEQNRFSAKEIPAASRILASAQSSNVKVNMSETADFLNRALSKKARELGEKMGGEAAQECLNILELAHNIGLRLDLSAAQDIVFTSLDQMVEAPDPAQRPPAETLEKLFALARALDINPKKFEGKILVPQTAPVPA